MADTAATTRPREDESACFTHTPVTRAFGAFLAQLTTAIEAERDIEGMSCHDPAYDTWLRESELCWEQLSNRAREAFEARITRRADRPLRYSALLINYAMGSESRGEFAGLRSLRYTHPEMFRCEGVGYVASRVNTMLDTAFARLDDIGNLEMIADDPEARTAPVCMFA